MTDSSNVTASHSETATDDLPDDCQALMARKAAIDAKIETVVVPAMRARWVREAADVGKTPEEILGIAGKKRGRKPKQKQDE